MVVGGRQAHCVLGTLKMVLDNSGIYVCVPTAREAKEGRSYVVYLHPSQAKDFDIAQERVT